VPNRHPPAGGVRTRMAHKARIIRGDSWGTQLQQALEASPLDVDSWMQQHTRLLKSDQHSRVGLLQLQHQSCYLKLYRPKSALQHCLFRLGRGRPVRSFDVARQLASSAVPLPRPLACLLVPEGMLLLTEGLCDALNLSELWRQQLVQVPDSQVLPCAGQTIAQLHRAGYAHGDCKWHNLLWANDKVYLIDLDGAAPAPVGGAEQARDLARFTLNAEELGVDAQLYERFLAAYLQGVGETRQVTIDRMMPILHKLRRRHLNKYGERGQHLL